ncbi:non-ribosomal peptide synthetase, partial [Pyxidicoccus fallax]
GATLVLAPRERLMPGAPLRALLRDESITAVTLTPSVLAQMTPEDFPALETLISAGEACTPELVERWGGRVRLLNAYGPTEVTVCATLSEPMRPGQRLSIGRPWANVRVYVLDAQLRPVPVGVPGELCVDSVGLARGYRHQAGLTAERFVPHPFSDVPGARLYRTGDRVRWLADGTLEYLGRFDLQVKLRGFRIELGEVETALSQHPSVREAVAVVREDAPGDKRLVAYVVAQEGDTLDTLALRTFLKQRLPEHMVPAALVTLDALPLTPNGKVNRQALPSPEGAQAAQAREYVAPRNRTEEQLAGMWAELLHVERVGVDDDFFELGGHSLLATQVVSRLQASFGVELPLREVFEAPTVAKLAARLQALASAGGTAAGAPALTRVERTGSLPLSFAQQRLWFLDQFQPGSPFYNLPMAIRLSGALDMAALERGLRELVRRHESLRTTFRTENGAPVQVISEEAALAFDLVDLSTLPPAQCESEVRRLIRETALHAFDLASGPLLRIRLLKRSEQEHVLVANMHHIVSDGWSLGVVVREFGALYSAFHEGRPSPLPELAVQYADFAAWQRAWLETGALRRQLDWWRGQLEGAPQVLALPTDHPLPAVQTFRGATLPVRLPRALSDAVNTLAQREGVTPFMVLLAAFQTLLSRYSGQEDLVIGTPVAGRNHVGTEGLVGFFVNTLALRARPSGDKSFRALLAEVKDAALGAFANQDVPFEKLVEELQPTRSLGHSPLFQVMFSLQNTPMPEQALPGLTLRPVDMDLGVAKFFLTLALDELPDGYAGVFEYNSDLFDAATIQRMASHQLRLLEAVVAAPEQLLCDLPLMSPEERHQLLVEWNDTAADYPRDTPVSAQVAARAARSPDAVALSWDGGQLTYAELMQRVGILAERLRGLGVGPEVRVGLCARRSPELVVGLLAILEAGGAWVPLEPDAPRERLAFMLEDARPAVLLTQRALRDALPVSAATVVLFEDGVTPSGEVPRLPRPVADNAAYVLFTSGSTGRPKGVLVSHRALARHTAWFISALELSEGDRVLQKASIGFDASVPELLATLVSGARLVLGPTEADNDTAALLATLARQQVTVLQLVPSQLRVLLEEAQVERAAGLRMLLSGGEALPVELVRRVRERLPSTRLINAYGPTETTVDATAWLGGEPGEGPSTTIGRPIANTQAYVLDTRGQPVPPGVSGELFIGGDGLARGYAGRPELTAERFVPDAFGGKPGARLYRTGDRARWRVDGTLEFLGRVDDQVKVRGVRIEPGEIEAVLAEHPAVRDTAVVAREDARGMRLVAYVVRRDSATETASLVGDLRTFLAGRLPAAMVPSAFVTLDALPLLSNGKLDRKALPAPEATVDTGTAYVAPRTPTEELLAGLFAQVLGVERVSAVDSFFDLGGHSLLATQVVSRVRSATGVDLPLRELFEAPTVAGLAARVDVLARSSEAAPLAPPLRPMPRTGPLPLSFAQQRLWFLDRLEPDSPFYNMPGVLRLEGTLDVGAMERSLTELVRRHEVLRTTFAEGPVQVIHPAGPVPLPVVDLSSQPVDTREAEVRRLAREEAQRPFNLSRGPLLRATLLKRGEAEHVLFLTLHHIVTDGWSMVVLVREMAALYSAFREGRASPLPELPVQYADYSAWQRGWLQGDALEAQLSWWREHLSGAPPMLELPTDFPRPAVRSLRGATHSRVLPKTLTDSLHALSRREGTTLFMALLAGFEVVLSRYSGQDDFVVGTDIANRNRSETEGLIGFFINQLALRARLDGDLSFRELLGRVRQATLGAYAHQDLPFEELVKALNPDRSLGHAPLFQVKLVLQNQPDEVLEAPGLTLRGEPIELGTSRLDITLAILETARGLECMAEYRTDLFEAATIDRLIRHLGTVLEAAAARPEARLSTLPLLPEDEQRRMLVEWNATTRDFPREACAHQLFEAQAARTPDAMAVRFEGGVLTYAQLDARANQLAHHLRALGVRAEVPVALCVERSLDTVVGILGILKAGGAYVPMDPSYPVER